MNDSIVIELNFPFFLYIPLLPTYTKEFYI